MTIDLPKDWAELLAPQIAEPYFKRLTDFVDAERQSSNVFPPEGDVFSALRHSTYAATRVVIIGQDPYHDDGQAHGLAFSVKEGTRKPPSLVNIFKELHADIGCPIPKSGSLMGWADQGVLLLNTCLTVRAHEANAHKGKGWETLTDSVIQVVSDKQTPVVFILWGTPARKKAALIDLTRHVVIESAHPSPLSARNGFFGSKPFSKANQALISAGEPPVDWCNTSTFDQ